MNSHIVEKTMHSIKNIDRLTDLAAIDVYNTTHDTINKYEIMKEHATEEYTNESFYQESVLAGVLIGAGILGVAISAFFIIKKIIDTKAAGDSSVKSPDGKMIAEQVDLRDPKSVAKYIEAIKARLKEVDDSVGITLNKSFNAEGLEKISSAFDNVIDKLQEIIDNKQDADAIKKIIDELPDGNFSIDGAFSNAPKEINATQYVDSLGIDSVTKFAQTLGNIKKKIDEVEKSVNKNGKDGNTGPEVSADYMKKLKDFSTNLGKSLDALIDRTKKDVMHNCDVTIANIIKTYKESKAEKKDEKVKSAENPAGTGATENKTETDKSKPEAQPTAGTGADDKGETKKQQTPEEQSKLQKNTSALIAIKNALSKYLSADECEKIQSEIFHEVHDEDGTRMKDILMGYHNDIKSNPAKYHVSSVDDAELVMGNIHKMAMTLIDNCKIMYDPKVAEKAEIYITGNNLSEITTFNNADFNQEEPKADEPKVEEPKSEESKADESKAEEPAAKEQPKQISPEDRQIIDEIKDLIKANNSVTDASILLRMMSSHAKATDSQIKSCTAIAHEELKAENPPTPTDQTGSDDEKITKLANELYRTPTDDNKREILGDLNRLREGESSVITHLNDVKTSLLERIKNGQDSSMSQAILNKIVYDYEAIAKEFGINADYLKSYDKTILTEAPNNNAKQVTYGDDGKIIIDGKNTGVKKNWSDDMNERAEKMISILLENKYKKPAKLVQNIFAGGGPSGDLKTRLNDSYQYWINEVKDGKATPEKAIEITSNWHDMLLNLARGLGEDENLPLVPDFKAMAPSEMKSENENKEKSKPTASDFENFKNPEANPESQQRFNSEINNADKSSSQSVQSDEAALRQASLNRQAEEEMRNKQQIQNRFNAEINGSNTNPSVQSDEAALRHQAAAREASAKEAAAGEINKYQPNINGTLSSDSEENKAAQWIANAQSHDQEEDSGSNLGTNFLNAVRNGKAKMNEQPSTGASDSSEQKSEPSTTEEPKTPEASGRLIPSALSQDEVEAIRNSIVHEFTIRNYPSTFAEQLADVIIDKYDGDVVKYAIDGYNNAKGKNAQQIKTNKGKIYNRAIILANIFNIPEDEIPKPDEKIETTNTEQQNPGTDVETNQEKTPEWQKISDEASHNTNGSVYNSGLPVTLNEPDMVDIDSIATDIKNGKSEAAIAKSLTDKGYSQADAIRYINMAKEDIDEEQSNPVQSDEERAAQWIANAKANGGSQNTQPTEQSVQDQNGEITPTLGTNFLNAVRNGKAKMDEQPVQPQLAQPQPEASQDTTNPGPDDEERAAQWIANAKANEAPETPETPAVDSTNTEANYGANWLNYMQQAQKENEINNNIKYLRDEGYNNDQIRDLLAKQGYDRNDVNTVLNMSDDQLKAIQDAINNNNADTITSQDHDAVPAPPQLPKKIPLEPETHIDLDAAAPVNEVPAGVNQVNINDAEEAAKNNYLNTRIAKNPKLGYPSLEALNNAVDELIAMIKQNVAIGNDPSQYAVGVLHNIYNIASAKNKMALPFDKLAALKAVKQYIKYRMIKQGVGNYFAEMTENDIGYYNLIQEYKIEIIREEKLKMIQEQQG